MNPRRVKADPNVSIEAAAAEICGDSVEHLVRWLLRRIYDGRIRAYKVGKTWRLDRKDIDSFKATLYNDKRPSYVVDTQPTILTAGSLNRRRTT